MVTSNEGAMGYDNRACKASCGECGATVCWSWGPQQQKPHRWDCKCGMTNVLAPLSEWPDVPRELYAGHDKNQLLKLYPMPPEHASANWAQPYSIRSFVAQASQRLGGCIYGCTRRGEVMGQAVFSDYCEDPRAPEDYSPHDCHMLAGWTIGEASCLLWERVAKLCQTEAEIRFLYNYLGLARDRQFPMLIPQVRVGIAERRRPDFVVFVPLQYWKYKRYAVQLDGAHPKEAAAADAERDGELAKAGYVVKRVTAGAVSEVKAFVEEIDGLMTDVDPWKLAVMARVKQTFLNDDVPF